jgi:hypothetical protein
MVTVVVAVDEVGSMIVVSTRARLAIEAKIGSDHGART